MPRPYSIDLRERAVSECKVGGSCREAARTFNVSASRVAGWTRQFARTGPVRSAPKEPLRLRPAPEPIFSGVAFGSLYGIVIGCLLIGEA